VRREERDAGFVFTSGFEINQGIYTKATKRTKFRMSVEQEVAEGRERMGIFTRISRINTNADAQEKGMAENRGRMTEDRRRQKRSRPEIGWYFEMRNSGYQWK
jgi:hypothetical protein